MANKSIPELVKFIIDNSTANDLQASLKDVEKDMAAFSRTISSATNSLDYYNSKMKKIVTEGSQAGFFRQEFVVNKADASNVFAALQSKNQQMSARQGQEWAYDIAMREAPTVQGTMRLFGKEAIKLAEAEVKRYGGELIHSPTKKYPNRYQYFYQTDDPEKLEGRGKTSIFKESRKLSSKAKKEYMAEVEVEKEKKAEEEAKKIVEEEKKRQDARQKEIEKYNKEEDKRKAEKEKAAEAQAKQIVQTEKKEALARQKEIDKFNKDEEKRKALKEKEDAKAKREAEKKSAESRRKRLSVTRAILGVATLAVTYLARIARSALGRASEINKEATAAHTVGLTLEESRQMRFFDMAHGLPEGTSIGAVRSIQSMFGDITNLNEGALATLARVMGSDIARLVKSGMGGEDPDKLLEVILDKYFKQFKEGKNSLGQYVGQEAALRELYTSLESVSGDVATMFAKMADDYWSGNYQFDTAEEWRNTVEVVKGNIDAIDMAYSTEVGKKFDEALTRLENIKENFLLRFANSTTSIIDAIKNSRIGMSAEEKLDKDVSNLEKVREDSDKQRFLYLQYANKISKNPTFLAEAGNFSLFDILTSGLGLDNDLGWIKKGQAKKIYNKILTSSDAGLVSDFALAAATMSYRQVLDKEAAKPIGSKIDDVTLSPIAISSEAKRIVADATKEDFRFAPNIKELAVRDYLETGEGKELIDLAKSPNALWSEVKRGAFTTLTGMSSSEAIAKKFSGKTDEEIIDMLVNMADGANWFGSVVGQLEAQKMSDIMASDAALQSLITQQIMNTLYTNNLLGHGGSWETRNINGHNELTIHIETEKGTQDITLPMIDGMLVGSKTGFINVTNSGTEVIYETVK